MDIYVVALWETEQHMFRRFNKKKRPNRQKPMKSMLFEALLKKKIQKNIQYLLL